MAGSGHILRQCLGFQRNMVNLGITTVVGTFMVSVEAKQDFVSTWRTPDVLSDWISKHGICSFSPVLTQMCGGGCAEWFDMED